MEFTPSQQSTFNQAIKWWKSIQKYYSSDLNRFINLPRHLQHFTILGQAGTGKSSICNSIISSLDVDRNRVLFMAPTGKASSILRKKGIPCNTIHSSILIPRKYHKEYTYRSKKHKNVMKDLDQVYRRSMSMTSPLFDVIDFDNTYPLLMVIDEVGMVGHRMEEDLVRYNVPIICMGDPNQLPPIMDRSSTFFLSNVSMLTEICRQALDSPIIYLANRIINDLELIPSKYEDSIVLRNSNKSSYYDDLLSFDSIITCTRETSNNVNRLVRKRKSRLDMNKLYKNDKVMCLENHFDIFSEPYDNLPRNTFPLTNGTCGIISSIDTIYEYKQMIDEITLITDYGAKFTRIRVTNSRPMFKRDQFDRIPFMLAYASTIHKLQGSEYEYVLGLMFDKFGSKSNHKKLLYTCVTRASKRIKLCL